MFKVVVVCLALAIVPIALAQEFSEQFRKLDRNKDGELTKAELPGPLFEVIDVNKDGVITAFEDQNFVSKNRGQAGTQAATAKNSDKIKVERDIPYTENQNPRQRLDLFLPKTPKSDKPLPMVIFIHGGAWQAGDKRVGYNAISSLVESGEYAGASIGYRLSSEQIWPAQIHDCKAAIRWLKANAKKYNLDPDRFGVTGTSAGGHLVAMLGTSGGVSELEGNLGGNIDVSSRVACVVDQFGPTDLLSMGGSHNNANSPESNLIGGAIQQKADAARNASPTRYVSKDDPPFMLIHGTNDPLVPFNQSEILAKALKDVGVEALLVPVVGGGHGNFGTPEVPNRVKAFFDKHLLKREASVTTEPIQAGVAAQK